MNKILSNYIFELPHIGRTKALLRVLYRLLWNYRWETIARHRDTIVAILDNATGEDQ